MIECKIEQLHTASETVWILSMPAEAVADTIVQFAALYFQKSDRLKFLDRHSGTSAIVAQKDANFNLTLDSQAFPVTKEWLECVAAMLTDVAVHGWNQTSHIDQDFNNARETVTLCIHVDPPV